MPDTHDERGKGEGAAALRNINDLLSDENLEAHRISASIAAAIRGVRQQLAAVAERADLAEAQMVEIQAERSEWQRRAQRDHLIADILRADLAAATARAEKAEAQLAELGKPTEWGQPQTEWTWSARKPDGTAVPPMFPDPHPPRTEESVRREFNGAVDTMGYRKVLLCRDVTAWRDANAMHGANVDDGSGWTAEENAEFEQRYGIKAAMRLRAANDRVRQVVQELRQAAVDDGRDPYQDPMAQRLSAALVGAGSAAEAADGAAAGWTDYGDGWSSRRPDESLDGLRGPFTGLLGPLGIADATAFPLADCPNPYRDGTCHHLTCARCKQHTDNSSQGHWWAYCKVTKTKREHHFCCPGDCELEHNNTTEDDRG